MTPQILCTLFYSENFFTNTCNNNSCHYYILYIASPPPPAPNCTITATSGHRAVNLQWLDGFNSLHVVEDYRVMVTPDPSSCSRNHVSPNVTYNCFGLELGTNYSFSFSALNCGGQEGHVANCWVQTQGLYVHAIVGNITKV